MTSRPQLLGLLLHHEHFAWLRSLSAMIAAIDAALDETDDAEAGTETFVQQVRALLRSDNGLFGTKYREALQRSPDVVMAHAAVVKLL